MKLGYPIRRCELLLETATTLVNLDSQVKRTEIDLPQHHEAFAHILGLDEVVHFVLWQRLSRFSVLRETLQNFRIVTPKRTGVQPSTQGSTQAFGLIATVG